MSSGDTINVLLGELHALRKEVVELKQSLTSVTAETREIRSLVGPVGIPMPDGEMLVQTIYGVKYLIDPTDIIMAPNLIIYRQWEPDLSGYFWKNFNQDTVFVDIGANFGYFSCLAGSRIGSGGTGCVLVVEPNPNCLKLLDRNIVINWSMAPISVFRGAVGAHTGQAVLSVPKGRAANASLSEFADDKNDVISIEVDIKKIDDIVPAHLSVDFMKIDVEGHEHAALVGARSVISRSPNLKIIMEWSQPQLKQAGYTVEDMLSLFDELNLQPYRIGNVDQANAQQALLLSKETLASLSYDNIILASKNIK